ncbi:vesicle transport protein SEC20 isoform X1 [Entelurus aequoreus]|uniref:vesicle transport protein SEC20 isoform X1 n=1 Tax=Entelurus aequoreus TaxID=161455 RepID=UPI002B1D5663|nr:vesicle transport protein SEC20 isoform X1 [Entelurus aequoreus]XP_061905176.1 vesicle transport protein SEC20 isoform X1 [Entelurus aequoreus]
MAASSDVHVRICAQEMIKYDLEIKVAVQDIRECSGPQSVLMQLNCHVKDKFNQLRRRIQVSACVSDTPLWGLGVVLPCAAVGLQDLEQMAREQDKESDRMSIQTEAESQRRQMLSNQTAWRKANLACKMSMDHMAKDELLREGEGQNIRARKATKESLVGSSSNITESLMSISRMMAEQVKQSEDSISTLATSSRTVQETNEEFKSMTGTIHLGRKLILKYNRRELTDKLLIFLALALFLATVLYILKKRLFPFI